MTSAPEPTPGTPGSSGSATRRSIPDDAKKTWRKLEKMKLSPDWDPGEPPVLTGFRIYPDRDVRVETDAGRILVGLAPESAPNTAWNFRHLAANGFYDDTTFHRVVHFDRTGRRFVIQGGDPSGTGEGSAGWDLPMENSTLSHDLGVISMARADHPDSAGSQFFFCLSREGTARLDGQYCAFGYAVEGAETIAKTADVEIEDVAAGKPTTPPSHHPHEPRPRPPAGSRAPRDPIAGSPTWWSPEVEGHQRRATPEIVRNPPTTNNDRPFECAGIRRGGSCASVDRMARSNGWWVRRSRRP